MLSMDIIIPWFYTCLNSFLRAFTYIGLLTLNKNSWGLAEPKLSLLYTWGNWGADGLYFLIKSYSKKIRAEMNQVFISSDFLSRHFSLLRSVNSLNI
jgi:hypothetical protein